MTVFHNIHGESITGSELFNYAYRAMINQTSRQYRKWLEEEMGEEFELDEAHEEFLTCKKVLRFLKRNLFNEQDIEEIYECMF